jgi:hypothetical protein
MQRLTTSASLRHYNVSIGLDDCLARGLDCRFFCCDPGRGHLPIQVDRTARAIIERAVDAFVAQQPHSTDVQSYAYTVEEEDQTLTRLNGLRDQSEAYHEGTPK